MGYSGFKGIGPNKIGAKKGGVVSPAKQTAKQKKNLPKQIVDAIADKAKSPAKKNGMKYDIKQASNQNLSASARKNYAENAQHDSKKGYR